MLVAEDLAVAETTAASSSNMQSGRVPGSYADVDETARQRPDDGTVLLANPVAPLENSIPQGSRLV